MFSMYIDFMRNLPERLHAAFQSALNFNPEAPDVLDKPLCPQLTHPLSFYDCHLDRQLALKNVKYNIALEKSSKDGVGLPSVERFFPEPQYFTRFISRNPAKDASDIGEIYRASISPFACELASMLSLHPTAAQWCTAVHMTVRIVSRGQKYHDLSEDYVPEILDSYEPKSGKEYTMVDKEAWAVLSGDDRRLLEEMRRRFPRMAVWQMFFACRETEDAFKNLDRLLFMKRFPEIIPSTLVKQWTPIDIPLAASPDPINTAWGTTLSFLASASVLETDVTPAFPVGNAQLLRRSVRLLPRAKLEEQNLKKTTKKSKQTASSSAIESLWPIVTIPTRKRDLAAIDEDMAISLIQHVMLGTSFVYSILTIRTSRHGQEPWREIPPSSFFTAELSSESRLFVSIIDDIRDRTRQLIAQEAKSKHAKRQGGVSLSENIKRPRTRLSVALDEARKLDDKQDLKAVSNGIANRDLALLRIQYGPYNSPAPSSFLRLSNSGAVMPQEKYQPHEYFRVTVTSEIARGSTGDTHAATIDFLDTNGKTVSFQKIVVKFAFAAAQKKRLRHEFNIYSHLMSANARGIPLVFGLFEDIETEALMLIMEHAGLTLWDCRLPDKSKRLQFVISESEKSAYLDALRSIHEAGVRHRDLRLENLTIKNNGDPCIIDFDRAEMQADKESLKLEQEKLQKVLDGQHEYRISRETTDEDTNPLEELENGTERSNSPGFQIGVLR
ncbi:hypothetical protein C0993_008412 [Termitomyces sp. T159_Od127]|nr:hypothetical protein C0993_008412 [Termitomyces sp. T159_Od127]